jgi:alcohol oxidase
MSEFKLAYYSLYICRYIHFPIFSPADLVPLRWAYKHLREIGRRMEFYRGDLEIGHPTFAKGSQAATQKAGTPVEISAPKIVYSKEDNDAIDEFHRRTGLCTQVK